MELLFLKAIQAYQISKEFQHFKVLREVSFEVEEGECYALFGPNGAGKTTLLKILSTLQRPTSGRFEMMGLDGFRERNIIRRLFLLIGHGSYFYDDLDAIENLKFSLAMHGMSHTDKALKVSLDRVGIGAFSGFKIRSFSEGMKKRLAIAKTMLIRPKVLLLDEPYSALDEAGMKTMNRFIREITRQGTAIFMTSHNRAQAAEVAQRAGRLSNGVISDVEVKDLVGRSELS